jgi:polar amino acid transport system substrate-binding protein
MSRNLPPTVVAGTLTIAASDYPAPPMSFVQEGEYRGYEPDLQRLICQRLGLHLGRRNLPMAEYYQSVIRGECDVVWFNQAITPERSQLVNFTQPYGLFDEAVLVKKEAPIFSPSDLSGRRLGGLADSTNLQLGKTFGDVTLVPYPGSDNVLPEMLTALRNGEIDALIDDELVLVTAAEADPSLRIAFTVPTRVPFGIGVHKDNSALLSALNSCLQEAIADGSMVQIWQKWIPYKPFPF